MTFLFSDGNFPFAVALFLMFFIALLEGVLVVIGIGLSQFLDSLLPDLDINIDGELPSTNLSQFLAWLRIGQVPSIVILVIFLLFFGLSGIILQSLSQSILTMVMPAALAIFPALFIALPLTHFLNKILVNSLFKDETAAISSADFIGQIVTITLGTARKNHPAEARFQDQFGTTHYLMVEPDDERHFHQGERVMLTQKNGAVYQAISSN